MMGAARQLETAEDVNEAYDAWVGGSESRQMKSEKLLRGTVVILTEHGATVARGRGRGLTNALANALENLP